MGSHLKRIEKVEAEVEKLMHSVADKSDVVSSRNEFKTLIVSVGPEVVAERGGSPGRTRTLSNPCGYDLFTGCPTFRSIGHKSSHLGPG